MSQKSSLHLEFLFLYSAPFHIIVEILSKRIIIALASSLSVFSPWQEESIVLKIISCSIHHAIQGKFILGENEETNRSVIWSEFLTSALWKLFSCRKHAFDKIHLYFHHVSHLSLWSYNIVISWSRKFFQNWVFECHLDSNSFYIRNSSHGNFMPY